MWHKAIWKGHPMRLELTRVGLIIEQIFKKKQCKERKKEMKEKRERNKRL